MTMPSFCYTEEGEAMFRTLSETPLFTLELVARGLMFTSIILEATAYAMTNFTALFVRRRQEITMEATALENHPRLSTGGLMFHTAILFAILGGIGWGLFHLVRFIGREVWGG